MLAWIGALAACGSLALTLMFLFRHPAHGFLAFRLGIGLTLLIAAGGMLTFLFERNYELVGVLALLAWIVGVVGGDLLIERMKQYEKESEEGKQRDTARLGYVSDLALQSFFSFLAALAVLIALLK